MADKLFSFTGSRRSSGETSTTYICRALGWVQRAKEINESEESVQQLFPHVLKL